MKTTTSLERTRGFNVNTGVKAGPIEIRTPPFIRGAAKI